MRYAEIKDDAVLSVSEFGDQLRASEIRHGDDGLPVLRPVIVVSAEDYDQDFAFLNGPIYEITPTSVMEKHEIVLKPDIEAIILRKIDDIAESMRVGVTKSVTMAMVYTDKRQEAETYLAGNFSVSNPPSAGQFPYIESCVGVDGDNMDQVATVFVTESQAFKRTVVGIEKSRLLNKKAVRDAVTPQDKILAFKAIAWNTDDALIGTIE